MDNRQPWIAQLIPGSSRVLECPSHHEARRGCLSDGSSFGRYQGKGKSQGTEVIQARFGSIQHTHIRILRPRTTGCDAPPLYLGPLITTQSQTEDTQAHKASRPRPAASETLPSGREVVVTCIHIGTSPGAQARTSSAAKRGYLHVPQRLATVVPGRPGSRRSYPCMRTPLIRTRTSGCFSGPGARAPAKPTDAAAPRPLPTPVAPPKIPGVGSSHGANRRQGRSPASPRSCRPFSTFAETSVEPDLPRTLETVPP